MKKVFLIIPSFAGGGAERVFISLATHLHNNYHVEFEVTLVVFSGRGPLLTQVPPTVRLIDLQSIRARQSLFSLFWLGKRERPDVVLTTMQASISFFIVQLFWRKSVQWVCRLENPVSITLKKMESFSVWLFAQALRACDQVVALNQAMAQDVVKVLSLKPAKIVVIPNPIDVVQVRLQSTVPIVPLIHPALIACGRLTPQKNFTDSILVFLLILDKYPAAHLYIIGEGSERPILEALITKHDIKDKVTLMGFIDNPYPYFVASDVFLLTSKWEGFGNVIVEAMACQTPVVSYDCPTGPRDILEGGRYGELVPIGDIQAFATAVDRILATPFSPELISARADNYAVSTIIKQYKELFITSRHV